MEKESGTVKKKSKMYILIVLLAVLIAGVGIYIFSKPKEEAYTPEEELPIHEQLAKTRMKDTDDLVVDESEEVEFKPSEGAFKTLSFGSVEEVVQSLHDVYGYDQFKLTKEKLFSEEYQVMMYVYTDKDKVFSIGEYDNGQVTFLSVKGEPELCEKLKEFAKDLDNNTGFQYKEIENGCVLER